MIPNIQKAFDKQRDRGYTKLYWAIDLHGTIIPHSYSKQNILKFYPDAMEVLKLLSNEEENCLILWTSTHEKFSTPILNWMDTFAINFDYVNKNPECQNITEFSDFTEKFYFDILLDDKAGFEPEEDWKLLKYKLWEIYKK